MHFNPYSIPLLLSLGAIFSIGLLAYRHNPSSPVHKSFFYFCLSLCFWLFNFAMLYNSANEKHALMWVRIGFLGNALIPILAYYFVNQLLHIKPILHIKELLIFALTSACFFNTDLIYAGIKNEFWGFYPIAGSAYFIYTLLFGSIFLYCTSLLYMNMRHIDPRIYPHKHFQVKYIFWAFIIGTTGIIDFIAKYPTHIYPFGWLSSLIFIALICYAILKYQIAENELLRYEVAKTEKFKAIANLASCLAHEIKNPITAISAFNEYLDKKSHDPQFIQQYKITVGRETQRINDLIHELLNFAKPVDPKFEPINSNALIEDLLKLLYPQTHQSKITVQYRLTKDPITLQADPSQLKQALFNILLNAIDAMPKGGTLAIASEVKQSKHTITISDTGYGIDPKDLPHIFEPFYTKKQSGTGLGLAITQGIIEKHSGKILVKSKINQGTIFTITLPKNV